MARKIAFTPASIDGLNSGSLPDNLTPGLAIEVLGSGKKRWRYRRKVTGKKVVATLFGGMFPAVPIAAAREWAGKLNEQVEAGIDPREALRNERIRATMTVYRAHELYMIAVRQGRSSRAKKPNKPRTIQEKLEIFQRDIAPVLGTRNIYEVTELDLIKLVEAKGKSARTRANRLAAELKVMFGWASSLRGVEVGLEIDPSRRLGDLRFPESPRSRKLSARELEWLLQALLDEPRHFQRGILLWLLTAARISEVVQARSSELVGDVWIIPAERVKNSCEHRIALGPWGRSLFATNHEWVFPAEHGNGPRNNSVWYKARDRVRRRMEALAGHAIERFTPHDFRRTARSNTKRMEVDFETAEAMLNHVKKGMERTYDLYDMEEEKRSWFLKWEQEIIEIARRCGVAECLGVPSARSPVISYRVRLPQRPGVQPPLNIVKSEARAVPMLAQATAHLEFSWKPLRTPVSQPVDLAPGQAGEPREFLDGNQRGP